MDSSDDEREDNATWRGIPASIVLINVCDPANKNGAAVAHAATCRMMRQHLRASDSHLIGVCLYGTENTITSAFAPKSVIDVIPLSTPTLDDFKKLRSLDMAMYKQGKDFELSDVLWHCSKMFANCKKQLSSRTVVMLTRLDTPPIQSDQKPTYKRVGDLVDSNIDIRIINISQDEYTVDQFYINFLIDARGIDIHDYTVPKPIWDPKEIEQMMQQQSHRHLAVARLTFEVGIGFSIGVGVYYLIKRSGQHNFQKKVSLDGESNALLTSVTKTVKVSTIDPTDSTAMDVDEDVKTKQMPLLKTELLHYLIYGEEKVEFTDNEKKSLQNPFGPPMMKLLGFKPATVLCKEKWFLKTGSFLFPSESKIEGSTVAFKALHQACVETKVVAICVLCTRVNSKPTIVALSPCTHPLGLNVEIGFDIIHIPFIEHVRDLPIIEENDESIIITNEQKSFMKDMLRSIQFDFKPSMFENPKLQSEYRAVEAIALEEEDLDPFIDTTKPEPAKFQNIREDLFEELFGPFCPIAPKRPAGQGTGPSKKQKTGEEFDESILNDRVKYKTVHQYTVTILKDILKRKDVPDMPPLTGLKKNELVELVYKYFD